MDNKHRDYAMLVWLYLAIGSFIFYTMWYASLGWFVLDPRQGQGSIHFWIHKTYIQDFQRESFTQSKNDQPEIGSTREVSFPRLLCGLFSFFAVSFVVLKIPLRKKCRFIVMLLTVLVTPLGVIYCTYMSLLARFIPILWGAMIGLTAIIILATYEQPWGWNPRNFVGHVLGQNWDRWLLLVAIGGLVPAGRTWMEATGMTKPINWFFWCTLLMAFGSFWSIFGLMWCGILWKQ